MKIRRLERIVVLGIGAALATLIACGSGDDDASSARGADGGASSGSSGTGSSSGGPAFGDGGTTLPAKGVILVHAAAFPSMRVCFENYPDLAPQPDRKVLPQANVVGVELGGLVRLGPMLTPPGKVFIISQKAVAAVPGAKDDVTCGQYLKNTDENIGWYNAGELKTAVGTDHAEVLALTGCGPKALLTPMKFDTDDCGPAYTGDAVFTGTFAMQRLQLTETITATPQTLPMTLVNMAPLLKAPKDQTLDVSFGELDAGPTAQLTTPIPTPPFAASADGGTPFSEGTSVTLSLDQTKESVFGLSGFRIAYRDAKGVATATSAGGLVVDQTLAQIQATSRSDGNPTSYYVANSNFVFFLLGDPRMQRTFADGGTNPSFDARRAVHMLAIPVRDDTEVTPLDDAGTTDAGDGGVK